MSTVRMLPSERKNRKSRGQGMLEFALALPIFLLLVLGVIEFGRLLAVVSSVTTAAREGARYGSAAGLNAGSPPVPYYNDCQGMREAAKRVGFFAGVQDANIAVGYFDIDSRANVPDPAGYGATKQCIGSTSTYLYDPATNPRVVLKVSVTFKFLFLGLPPFPITSQSARTIVTQIEMDVTPGTITPAPPKTATSTVTGTPPTPTNTATVTETATASLTPSETPTITGTLPTPTATSTHTLTATPLPVCGFVHVGAGTINGTYSDYNFAIYNDSGGSSLYPAQDVWVRIWRQLPSLRRDEDAGGWIHRVTTNVVRNDRRATRRRNARVALSADLADGVPESAEAHATPFATPTPIRRLDLVAAMSQLDGRQRQVYVLHDIEGLTDRDIADHLRIAPSTVRVQLARARATLRDILRP